MRLLSARTLATFAVVLISLSLRAQNAPEREETEEGCLGARVLDYLERHGDYGVIDPEALLYVTRLEHERRTAIHTAAISGNSWSSIGPTNGAGRATALALHPTVPGTAIIGAAGGGAWKTLDRGENWTPLTETIPNLSVGAIVYAPSDPNRVYLGTGEGGLASDFIPGIGLLVSNDGGATWTLPSTVLSTMFYRIAVHPANPDDVIVGTNKGALRSTAGAEGPWTTVIASSPGATPGYGDVTEIVRDPTNAAVLYAATWDRERWCIRNPCTLGSTFASPTILKSTNSGATWSAAATGLPVSTGIVRVERWSLAIAPSSPSTLYAMTALFNADTGVTNTEVYKTVDGGASWTQTALSSTTDTRVSNLLSTQGWYDNAIVVSPADANLVVAGGVQYARTTNGGATWRFPFTSGVPHVDVHDLRYDAAGVLWIANDGGIWTSDDNATTSTSRNTALVTRQYYAMAMDRINRNRILGGTQDNGTNRRPDGGSTSWSSFSGGDGFQCFIHPDAPGVAFSTFQFAAINRTTGASLSTPLVAPFGPSFPGNETKPFFSVLKADPASGAVIYTGSTRLWKSTTAGESWAPLSTNVVGGGGAWSETTTIRSIAISSGSQRIVVSKGTQVFRSTDGGASWNVITSGLPGRSVTNIEISPFDRETMFATIAGTSGSSVYVTRNGGTSWDASAAGLPSFSALVVRVDPTDATTVYCGTDVGVYRSTDGGANWSRFGSGLPAVSVYDIQILPDGSILRAATHGRGMWELAITGVTNNPPIVSVSAPASQFIARGSTITMKGTANDPNGDPMSVKWTFPDDWSTTPGISGATSAAHTFDRAGRWPVALTATDSHGATGGAETTIVVTESNDDCATPLVVPSAGPFPWSVTLNSESASPQFGFEPILGGSCYQFQPLRTMWLSFTPAVSGSYAFSLCTSRVSGFLAAYTGLACGPHVALPMCVADTTLGSCSSDPVSTIDLAAGVEVRLLVGSFFSNSFGQQTVTISRGTTVDVALRAVSPATSSISGGIDVVITGDGFASGAAVSFGGVPATNVTVIGATLITATVPAHAAGTVDVVVQTTKGTLTSSRAFTYKVPPSSPRRRATGH